MLSPRPASAFLVSGSQWAQVFTAGSDPRGYFLEAAEIEVVDRDQSPIFVDIYSVDGDAPDELLQQGDPVTRDGGSRATIRAEFDDLRLEPSTRYALAVRSTETGRVNLDVVLPDTAVGMPGW